MVGTSAALTISDIPWKGPISGVSVGYVDGEYVINPTAEQREKSQMAVTVASTDKLIAMIEAGANEVSDEVMFNGIMAGHEANQQIIEFIKGMQAEIGKEKFSLSQQRAGPGNAGRGDGVRHRGREGRAGYRRQDRTGRAVKAHL